jgi:hypothetical protein
MSTKNAVMPRCREAAGQTGDSMFGVELALMRVTGAAILAELGAPQTHAIQSLIDYHAIAGAKIFYFVADFFDTTADFVTEDLGIDVKRNRLTVFVNVIVRIAGEDMSIGAA